MKLTFTSMLVLCSIVPLATGTQKVRDGVITYPGGYTIEEGTPFVLPPPMKEAGYATDAIILNGPEPEVKAPWVGGGPTQRLLDLAAGSGGYVAAWNDTRDGNAALFVGFLDPTGRNPRDGAPVHDPRSSRQLYPNLELLDGDATTPVRGGIIWGANEMDGMKAKARYFIGPERWPTDDVESASEAFLIDGPRPIANLDKGSRPNLALAGNHGIIAWTVQGELGAYTMALNPQTGRYLEREQVLICGDANPKGGAFELAMNAKGQVMAAWSEARDGAPYLRLASVQLGEAGSASALGFGPGMALDLATNEAGGFWLLLQVGDELQLALIDAAGMPSASQDIITVAKGDIGEARMSTWGGGLGVAIVNEIKQPAARDAALRAARAGEVKLHVFAANGARVTPPKGLAALDDGAVDARDVHIAARDNDFLIAWTDSRHDRNDIYYRLINLQNMKAPAQRWNRDESSSDQVHAAVSSNGRTALVAWEDARRGDTEVFVRAVHLTADKQLQLGREGPLNSKPTGAQAFPALAVGANGNAFVVWKENLEGSWILRGQLLDNDGAPVGDPMDLDRGYMAPHNYQAALVALPGAGGFVVTWIRDGQGPMVRRFDKNGMPETDPKPLTLRAVPGASRPTIALGADDRLLVAWDQPGNAKPAPGSRNGPPAIIAAQFIDPSCSPVGKPIYFPPSPEGGDIDPTLTARLGGGFLLAWTGNDSPTRDVYARVLDEDGEPTGAPLGISVRFHEQDYAEATTLKDGRVLVAWEDDISGRDHCFVRVIDVNAGRGSSRADMGTRYLINDVETVFVEDRHAPMLAPLGDGAILVWDDLGLGKGHDIAARYVEMR